MPGNRLGWTIAAGLAVVLAWAAWQLADLNRRTPPTGLLTSAGATTALAFEIPADTVYAMTAAGDPTPLVRRAIDDIRRNPERYTAVERSAAADAFGRTPAGEAILSAAPMAMPLTLSADVAAWSGYGGPADDLDALEVAARALMRAGLLYRDKDLARSRQTFEAAFALGVKLFDERARYAEAALGLTIAREAVAGLRSLAERDDISKHNSDSPQDGGSQGDGGSQRVGDSRRVGLLTTFDRAAAGLQETRLTPVWRAVGSLDGPTLARHAGDVAALASPETAERMWRVEAALALGRHRYSLDDDADRLAASARLKHAAIGENDPLVRAAINAAELLTIEQYRTLR